MLWGSLLDTVSRVIHNETKRFTTRMRGDEKVIQEMRAGLEAEEAIYRRDRVEFQAHMQQQAGNGRGSSNRQKNRKQHCGGPAKRNAMPKA